MQLKSRIRKRSTSALVFILSIKGGDTFVVSPKTRSLNSVRLNFRTLTTDEYTSSVSDELYPIFKNPLIPSDDMPPWLINQRGLSVEKTLDELIQAMSDSYLSEKDSNVIIAAVKDASRDDPDKLTRVAEFCLILVETMEMDVDTIVAAAFHFCLCVTAREQSKIQSRGSLLPTFWDSDFSFLTAGVEYYGEDAVKILNDSTKLKRTEILATSVVVNAAKSAGRTILDSKDSENMRFLLLSEMDDWRALAIRSAACLYRLRGLINNASSGDGELNPETVRVAREAFRIYAPLASQLGMQRLKNELEESAFRILYKRQYSTVTSLLSNHISNESSISVKEGMDVVLARVTENVREVLEQDDVFVENGGRVVVSARLKESFSLWKKMLRLGTKNIFDVPDAMALRIILEGEKLSPYENKEITSARERALCYYVQKLCMERAMYLRKTHKMKDYIETPKGNGYQSLHFLANEAWIGEDWTFETQIRTSEMHRVAEYGLAAHWDYKIKGKIQVKSEVGAIDNFGYRSKSYMKSLQEWSRRQILHRIKGKIELNGKDSFTLPSRRRTPSLSVGREKNQIEKMCSVADTRAPYIEALSTTKLNLTKDHVFVLLSSSSVGTKLTDGKILSLPAGASVSDALCEGAKSLCTNLAWRPFQYGIKQNGSITNMNRILKNGDVLVVPVF